MRHLCDVNFWLALTLSAHVHSETARDWMDRLAEGDKACFCRQTEMSYLRLLTNAAAVGAAAVLGNAAAQDIYLKLRTDERVGWLDEPPNLRDAWFLHSRRPSASPKIWADAYLAALAQISGAMLVTFDTGFRSYAGLRHLIL